MAISPLDHIIKQPSILPICVTDNAKVLPIINKVLPINLRILPISPRVPQQLTPAPKKHFASLSWSSSRHSSWVTCSNVSMYGKPIFHQNKVLIPENFPQTASASLSANCSKLYFKGCQTTKHNA